MLVLLLGCNPVYDDVAISVRVPAAMQAEFAADYPKHMMRVVSLLDGEDGSLAVLCDLGAQDVDVSARYLQVGCYEEHLLEIYLVPLEEASGVPCGQTFELGQGGRDAGNYEPAAVVTIPVGDRGRCGEWAQVEVDLGG